MSLINRLVPVLSAFTLLVLFWLALIVPAWLFSLIGLSLVIVIVSTWWITGRRIFKSKFWNFLISPLIFILAGWLFTIFLDNNRGRSLVLLAIIFFYWLFFEVVYHYLYRRPRYQAHSLGNISSYLNTLSIFLLTSGFFNLVIFLEFPFWPLAVILPMVVGLLTHQLLWANEIPIATSRPYSLIISFIITELYLAIILLPTSVYVNGFILTVGYYIMSGLAKNWLLSIRDKSVFARYLTIGFILFIIILVSAKW